MSEKKMNLIQIRINKLGTNENEKEKQTNDKS